MKGEKVVTNLVPYGPEKPRSGMVKMAGTNQVTISKIFIYVVFVPGIWENLTGHCDFLSSLSFLYTVSIRDMEMLYLAWQFCFKIEPMTQGHPKSCCLQMWLKNNHIGTLKGCI